RLGQDLEARLAEALEGVRGRARLVRASAEGCGPGGLAGAGRRERLLARLDGAGAGDQAEGPAADGAAGDLDDRVATAELGRDQLVRLEDRDDLLDPRLALEVEGRDERPVVADGADDRDELAARGMGLRADLLDAVDDVADLVVGGALLHH